MSRKVTHQDVQRLTDGRDDTREDASYSIFIQDMRNNLTIQDIRAYARKNIGAPGLVNELETLINRGLSFPWYDQLPGNWARSKALILLEEVEQTKVPWHKRIFGQDPTKHE